MVLFDLCRQQLSSQSHYDFGLRSLKTILKSAGNLKYLKIREEFVSSNSSSSRGLTSKNLDKPDNPDNPDSPGNPSFVSEHDCSLCISDSNNLNSPDNPDNLDNPKSDAVGLYRSESNFIETAVCLSILPKLLSSDLTVFKNLLKSVFPAFSNKPINPNNSNSLNNCNSLGGYYRGKLKNVDNINDRGGIRRRRDMSGASRGEGKGDIDYDDGDMVMDGRRRRRNVTRIPIPHSEALHRGVLQRCKIHGLHVGGDIHIQDRREGGVIRVGKGYKGGGDERQRERGSGRSEMYVDKVIQLAAVLSTQQAVIILGDSGHTYTHTLSLSLLRSLSLSLFWSHAERTDMYSMLFYAICVLYICLSL